MEEQNHKIEDDFGLFSDVVKETAETITNFGLLSDVVRETAEAITGFVNAIPNYVIQELKHPRKKPRGSIRRKRKGIE